MTDDEAREWVVRRYGSETYERMERICDLVRSESRRQNLIAPSTLDTMWSRHIVDSAQLLDLVAVAQDDNWLDIGSGAGFPGLVIAALGPCAVTMVEPRKRRAAFLEEAIEAIGLTSATVLCGRVEQVATRALVISARAVAPLSTLLDWAAGCAVPTTRWVLPKGRSACEEVATAQQAWHGVFHVEHSITDPESMIVLATGVTRR